MIVGLCTTRMQDFGNICDPFTPQMQIRSALYIRDSKSVLVMHIRSRRSSRYPLMTNRSTKAQFLAMRTKFSRFFMLHVFVIQTDPVEFGGYSNSFAVYAFYVVRFQNICSEQHDILIPMTQPQLSLYGRDFFLPFQRVLRLQPDPSPVDDAHRVRKR